jgi:hypothetical protein
LKNESDAACYADHDALMAMLTTKPTTVAGTLALLEYLRVLDEQDDDILTICGPSYELDDNGNPPRGGCAYRLLLNNLVDALRPAGRLAGLACAPSGPFRAAIDRAPDWLHVR